MGETPTTTSQKSGHFGAVCFSSLVSWKGSQYLERFPRTDSDRLPSLAFLLQHPWGPALACCAFLAVWGFDIREEGGKRLVCGAVPTLLFMGTRSAGTALPCGSFLLVVEELCPGEWRPELEPALLGSGAQEAASSTYVRWEFLLCLESVQKSHNMLA